MSARRRALLVTALALLLGGLAWLGALVVGGTRIDLGTAAGEGGIRVSTDFPEATCSKSLGREFPWFRLSCEPRDDASGSRR